MTRPMPTTLAVRGFCALAAILIACASKSGRTGGGADNAAERQSAHGEPAILQPDNASASPAPRAPERFPRAGGQDTVRKDDRRSAALSSASSLD